MNTRIIFLLLLSVIWTRSPGQEENTKAITGKAKGYSLFWGGVETSTTSYINNETKDSNGVHLYLAPYLDYNHRSGVGIRVKTYVLPGGSDPGFFLSSISPYYALYTGKLLPFISYTRYLQHDNPSVPYTPIQNELYAHLRVKTPWLDPMAGIDLGFGNDEENNDESVSDLNAFIALTRLFYKEIPGGGRYSAWGIRPALQLNAGTDRYYKFLRTSGYISQNTRLHRTGYMRGSGGGNQGGGNQIPADEFTISSENEFRLSNIETNLHLMYFIGSFSIEPSGSLYFPLRGDDRSPYGYWQLNLNYWF